MSVTRALQIQGCIDHFVQDSSGHEIKLTNDDRHSFPEWYVSPYMFTVFTAFES